MSIIKEYDGELNAEDCREHPLFFKWALSEDAHRAFLEYLKKNYVVKYTKDSSGVIKGTFYTIYDNPKTIYYRYLTSPLEIFLLDEEQCLKDITEDVYSAFISHYLSKGRGSRECAQATLDKLIEDGNCKEIIEPYLDNFDEPVAIRYCD